MQCPQNVKELREKLDAEWSDDNVICVGSGYGYYTDDWQTNKDAPTGWFLTVYAERPDKAKEKLPHEVDGVPIRFCGKVVAL
jgi:hypothetical protein